MWKCNFKLLLTAKKTEYCYQNVTRSLAQLDQTEIKDIMNVTESPVEIMDVINIINAIIPREWGIN